ncbi:hypothetical protein IU459_12050 [Nocardia amamiensis]|uniref:Uncharacterized protein n=1 Tax=Nocardia amamiensis TaxID=404578 RepID=A0ABS0CTV5_9NOCA|nr:hypothetical protein [Nocardia amamiensis]MBF6298274.1 hypothetical protein [Nocardia amamiensis]
MEIRPITGSPAAADVAADLRALADLVENDGDGFVAAMIAQLISGWSSTIWPAHVVGSDHEDQRAEVFAEALRRLKPIASGPMKKDYNDTALTVTIPIGALSLKVRDMRESVCERVVTGVETVSEEIPDPDYIAAAPKITQTREVEVVEWRCAPVLAAGQGAEVKA